MVKTVPLYILLWNCFAWQACFVSLNKMMTDSTELDSEINPDCVSTSNVAPRQKNSVPNCSQNETSNKSLESCSAADILETNFAEVLRPPGCTRGFARNSVCFFGCKKYFTLSKKHDKYKFSKCTDKGLWEPPIPECVPVKACPGPVLPKGLHFERDCSKSVGSICQVKCKENMILYGSSFLLCQENGLWTNIPKCGCSMPAIPDVAGFQSGCSPYISETCFVQCQNGFVIEGPPVIKCDENGSWSKMPKCLRTCPPLKLPAELKLVQACRYNEGEICHLSCGKKKLLGPISVTCQSNGSWSTLPSCSKKKQMNLNQTISTSITVTQASSVSTASMQPVSMSTVQSASVLIASTHPYLTSASVSIDLAESASLEALLPMTSMKPVSTYINSAQPVSTSIILMSFPSVVKPSANPSSTTITLMKNASTSVSLPIILSQHYPTSTASIQAASALALSQQPVSTPVAAVSTTSKLVKITINKLNRERQRKCSKSKIPKNVVFIPTSCKTSKIFKCKVGCKTPLFKPGAKKMKYIIAFLRLSKCTSKGEWKNLPNCTAAKNIFWYDRLRQSKCSKPAPTKNMIIQKTCSRNEGSSCTVSCEENFSLEGPKVIKCLNKTWTPFPVCKQITNERERQKKCSLEKTPKNIIFFPPSCKKSKKFKCKVGCRTPLFISAAQKVKYIGANLRKVHCTPKGKWKNFPNCTVAKQVYWYDRIEKSKCTKPILPQNLVIQKNCSQIAGTACGVSCKKGYIKIGPGSIKCSKKKWSHFPTCEREPTSIIQERSKKCSTATIPKDIIFFPPSCKKSDKFKCTVGCRTPVFSPHRKKKLYVGAFLQLAHCSLKGEWKNFPNCTAAKNVYWFERMKKTWCSKPNATQNLIISKKCPTINGSVCVVSCASGYVLAGPKFIKCLNKKWSPFPVCSMNSTMSEQQKKCSTATVPKHISFHPWVCKWSGNLTCEVSCITPLFRPGLNSTKYIRTFSQVITCTTEGKWIDFPNCTYAKQVYWYDRMKKINAQTIQSVSV